MNLGKPSKLISRHYLGKIPNPGGGGQLAKGKFPKLKFDITNIFFKSKISQGGGGKKISEISQLLEISQVRGGGGGVPEVGHFSQVIPTD